MSYDDTDVIETSTDEQHRVILVQDTDAERPMDNGDWWVSSVLTLNGWGDWEVMRDPADRLGALTYFVDTAVLPADVPADEAFKRYMRIFHGIEVYDVTIHNGYRDTSNALAWIEPSELERVGLDLSDADDPQAVVANRVVEVEIAEHNRWADGEVYGYVVQKAVVWTAEDHEDMTTWEDTDDSLWGLVGRDYAEQSARAALLDTVA